MKINFSLELSPILTKKVAQSSNFQTSGIEVFKNSGKNTKQINIKIKTVLFIEFKKNSKCTKYITPPQK